jgi:hypothetical protein
VEAWFTYQRLSSGLPLYRGHYVRARLRPNHRDLDCYYAWRHTKEGLGNVNFDYEWRKQEARGDSGGVYRSAPADLKRSRDYY